MGSPLSEQRPHRGIGMSNQVLDGQFKPQREGQVRCREKGGAG